MKPKAPTPSTPGVCADRTGNLQRAKTQAQALNLTTSELVADVVVLLEQLALMEHYQDRGEIARLRRRYNWRP